MKDDIISENKMAQNKNRIGNHIVDSSGANDAQKYLNRMKGVRKVKKESFGSQKVDINDYILSPEGWEGLMFFLYFVSIPYLIGALFLFIFIAQGSVINFFVLDISAFFIVWAIGYEVIASLILITIFFSYLNYVRESMTSKIH
ncbi:hypothetical protein [Sulfurimonas sp. HSL3-2]|uniref:hypothetical protein n=1 Tax=Hydrocurvibacter mobilis TaxID=3131936 RepID=UPI0031F88507